MTHSIEQQMFLSEAREVAELKRIGALLTKYSSAYHAAIAAGRDPSDRLCSWIAFYEDERGHGLRAPSAAWLTYCAAMGYDTQHTAYDCFA